MRDSTIYLKLFLKSSYSKIFQRFILMILHSCIDAMIKSNTQRILNLSIKIIVLNNDLVQQHPPDVRLAKGNSITETWNIG